MSTQCHPPALQQHLKSLSETFISLLHQLIDAEGKEEENRSSVKDDDDLIGGSPVLLLSLLASSIKQCWRIMLTQAG